MTNTIYAEALDNDEPIQIEGFTLYPIQVRHFRIFDAARSSLLIRQGGLPVEYAVMPYLGALYAMDYDARKENGQALGYIRNLVTMLALAMRFPADALLRNSHIKVTEQDDRKLVSIDFQAGETYLRLTPEIFDRIRPILAEQNGMTLPDEAENIDLVEADSDIAAKNSESLKLDFRTLLSSIARDQRCRRSDLMDYTIREFLELRDAIERDKMFTICQMAEYAGDVKFPKGNPYPSWCYDRGGKRSSMISMTEFMAGPGSVASMK